MGGRPEAGDSYGLPDDFEHYNREAWEDFTPWRPGDALTSRSSFGADVRSALGSFFESSPDRGDTQDTNRRLQQGDFVQSTTSVGGVLGSAVPAGTWGEVVSVEQGLFTERVTIQFENGYRETLDRADVRYDSGWY